MSIISLGIKQRNKMDKKSKNFSLKVLLKLDKYSKIITNSFHTPTFRRIHFLSKLVGLIIPINYFTKQEQHAYIARYGKIIIMLYFFIQKLGQQTRKQIFLPPETLEHIMSYLAYPKRYAEESSRLFSINLYKKTEWKIVPYLKANKLLKNTICRHQKMIKKYTEKISMYEKKINKEKLSARSNECVLFDKDYYIQKFFSRSKTWFLTTNREKLTKAQQNNFDNVLQQFTTLEELKKLTIDSKHLVDQLRLRQMVCILKIKKLISICKVEYLYDPPLNHKREEKEIYPLHEFFLKKYRGRYKGPSELGDFILYLKNQVKIYGNIEKLLENRTFLKELPLCDKIKQLVIDLNNLKAEITENNKRLEEFYLTYEKFKKDIEKFMLNVGRRTSKMEIRQENKENKEKNKKKNRIFSNYDSDFPSLISHK